MRIVVADPDERLVQLLRTVLAPQGHELIPASDTAGCQGALMQHTPDVVVVAAELPGGGAHEALASWRGRALGRGAHVVLTSAHPKAHPAVVELLERLQTPHFLRKPFSMLDLSDTINGLQPRRPPAPAPVAPPAAPPFSSSAPASTAPGRRSSGVDHLTRLLGRGGAPRVQGSPEQAKAEPEALPVAPPSRRPEPMRANRSLVPRSGSAVSRDNAARLGALWAGMETGRLFISGASSPVGRPVLFRDGGLVNPRHLDLIDLALREGRLRFEAGDVDGVGDHRALGSFLVAACRGPEGSAAGFSARHTFDAPQVRSMKRPLSELPVSADTRAVLGQSDGRNTLGRLLAMMGIPPESVDSDLACLRRLGLITLLPPRTRRRARPQDGGSGRAPAGRGAAEPSSDAPTAPGPRAAEPDSVPTEVAPSTVSSVRRRSQSAHSRSTQRDGTRSRSRRHMPRVQSAALEKQLQRELSRLEGASPAMVLGVPADSGASLVEGVAARQRDRYTRISQDVRNSETVRELAASLVEMVEEAESKWGDAARTRTGVADSERELQWLEQGVALIEAGDFRRADRVLSKARDLTIANPDILAWLGVARLGNPDRGEAERRSEGLDLLLLAEQFNPQHPVALPYLARTLSLMGDGERALLRARKWARLEPDNGEAQALVRELSPEPEPGRT